MAKAATLSDTRMRAFAHIGASAADRLSPLYRELPVLLCYHVRLAIGGAYRRVWLVPFRPLEVHILRPAAGMREIHSWLQVELLLADRVVDLLPGAVLDLEHDGRRLRPAEHLHRVVMARGLAAGDGHRRLGRVGVEHVSAVARRVLPALEEALRQRL